MASFKPGPEDINLFSSSTHLSIKFIILVNVKMPTIVDISPLISRVNDLLKGLKHANSFDFNFLFMCP